MMDAIDKIVNFMGEPRRVIFTKREKSILLSLLKKHSHLLTNKCYTFEQQRERHLGWQNIEKEFNSCNGVTPRSAKQLSKCWDNMKSRRRRFLKSKQKRDSDDVSEISDCVYTDPSLFLEDSVSSQVDEGEENEDVKYEDVKYVLDLPGEKISEEQFDNTETSLSEDKHDDVSAITCAKLIHQCACCTSAASLSKTEVEKRAEEEHCMKMRILEYEERTAKTELEYKERANKINIEILELQKQLLEKQISGEIPVATTLKPQVI